MTASDGVSPSPNGGGARPPSKSVTALTFKFVLAPLFRHEDIMTVPTCAADVISDGKQLVLLRTGSD